MNHAAKYNKLRVRTCCACGFTVVTLGLSVTGIWVFFSGRKKRREAKASALDTEVEVPA